MKNATPLKEDHAEINDLMLRGQMRPLERVLKFLSDELERSEWEDGGRLPTNRELAEKLKVSIPTVNSAIGKLVEQGRIRTKKGSGKYFVPQEDDSLMPKQVAVSLPLDCGQLRDQWANAIGAGMFNAMLRASPPVALIGATPLASGGSDVERLLAMRKQVSGLILFPFDIEHGRRQELVNAYEESGKPVVFINPDRVFGGANFVSSDYYGAGYRLGKAWKQAGRRNIVLMCGSMLENSVSFQLWHSGLCWGLGGGLNEKITLVIREKIAHVEESGYQAMREILKSSKRVPDAVFSLSDNSAIGAAKALQEAGLEIPADVSVVGASGLDIRDGAHPYLTRIRPAFEQWGQSLIEMITQRIALKGARLPGIVLPTPFIGGKTTTTQENEILGIDLPQIFIPSTGS